MKGMMPTMGWVLVGLALVVSFWVDFANTARGGAIDLRNRITGVRLLEHGIDPYHYKWHEGEPAEYCDVYNNPKLPVSKTTATPALLMLHLPLAALPYRLAQLLWLFLQWLLLLGTGRLWLRLCATSWQRWVVALFVTGFTYTTEWRLHAERGQVYVLLTFLFAWWLTATPDPKARAWGNGFTAGCVAGFLAALRPPFALLTPFLALHRRGQLAGAAAGLLLGFGLPLLMNPAGWTDYFSAMETHSELYRADFDPRPGLNRYPPRIERIPTRVLGSYAPIPFADFSAHALLRRLGLAPFPAPPVLLALVVPFAFWLWLSRGQPVERLLLGMAVWLFLTDLFLPAFRDSYDDVLILNVVLLGIVTAKAGKFPWAAWPCVLGLPVGWAVYAFAPEQGWLINLPTALFALGAILFLFLPGFRRSGGKNGTYGTQGTDGTVVK
jgi:hypothetical protein